ncbi:MAG: glycosyltransferase [Planctomycetota bacterium]
MRLLVVSKSFPPRNSARSLQIGKVTEAIRSTGVELRIIAGLDKKTANGEGAQPNGSVVYVPYSRRHDASRLVDRVLKFLDEEISSVNRVDRWVRRCVAEALKQIEAFRPECLLTSSVPFETHLVGLAVKRLTGVPWVASFSDPWPFWLCPRPYYRRPFPILRRMNMTALARVIKACDAVHMPSRYGIEWTARASGLPIESKGVAIPHIGFSVQSAGTTPDRIGWLAHVGHLSRERASEAVLRGVQKAHQRIPGRFNGLLCVGWVCPKFREMVRGMGLEHIVRFTGRLPAAEAATVVGSTTALLVVEADMDISPFLPSKFADYALAGRPILAITPATSAIRNYLARYGGGAAVRHDAEEIAEAITNVFRKDAEDGLSVAGENGRLADVFSPITVGNQYRELFSAVLTSRTPGEPHR